MHRLTKIVINRPVAALVCVIALVLFGFSAATGMKLELYPQTNYPMLFVTTIYPQAGSEEVERLVTEKIEESCGTLPGLKQMTSSSAEEASNVTFQFVYGTDLAEARNRVAEALEDAKLEFPDGVKNPTIISMNSSADAAISVSVSSTADADIYNVVKQRVVPQLKKISDAAAVKFYGGDERYISIELYPEILSQYHFSVDAVKEIVTNANFIMTAGRVNYGNQTLNVDSRVEYKSVDEIRNIPIKLDNGASIHLSDIANVHYAKSEPYSYSRFNGTDNVTIDISKKQSANMIALSKDVKATLEQIKEQNPDLEIEMIFDSSDSIVNSIKSIGETLVLGIALSMLVLFIFFGDLKASLIVGSSMPISLLATFILMARMGFTLNMITMSALVIGVGMMVDNAIVVIEMCFRKKDEGFDFKEAAYEGAKVVTNSIIASTMTTVVVYLPLSNLKGMSGSYTARLVTLLFLLCSHHWYPR